MGSEALGMYRCVDSLLCLLDILRHAEPHLFLRDEAVLAMASILGTQRKFYPVLVKYVADNSLVVTLGMDEVEAASEYYKTAAGTKKKGDRKTDNEIEADVTVFHSAAKDFMENKKGAELSRWILELPENCCRGGSVTRTVLSEAALDDEYITYNCLSLLIIHWAAQQLRVLADMDK
jgi:hypothetical protein